MTTEINPNQNSTPVDTERVVPQDLEVAPGRERLVTAELRGDEPLGDQPAGTSYEDEHKD